MPRKLLSIFALLAAAALAQTNSTRVFELRTYHCNEGRWTPKTRFRDHTIEIFKRHGIESIAYWTPRIPTGKEHAGLTDRTSQPRGRKSQLGCVQRRSGMEEGRRRFRKRWKIVQKVDSLFLDPTDFSALK